MSPTVILSTGQRLLRFEQPADIICATTAAQVPRALQSLQRALDEGRFVAGFLAYELGATLLQPESILPDASSTPLLWFGVFKAPAAVRRKDLVPCGRGYSGPLHHEWGRLGYRRSFECIQEHIRAGEIYQANLSFRSRFHFFGDPFDLYLRLYDAAQVPYAGYVDTGELQVLSLSPELFFQIHGEVIETQPMKGTAARGQSPDADQAARAALSASAKERAENVMIVDLMRNDLGRLAVPGSVRVAEMLGIRTYPTYHTMVSTITAKLRSAVSFEELLRALLPAGSITGVPKLRAMQILRELECGLREAYCGALGYVAPGGDASFNVAIRTLWLNDQSGKMGVGGAVVADSNPDDEYDECLLKASWFVGTRRPIGLIETLRWGPDFERLDRHLDRMAHSARALALPFRRPAALGALLEAVANATEPLRVRIELDEAGKFRVDTSPLGTQVRSWRFVISPQQVDSRDALLAHKTSWRDRYDAEWNRCCADGQADEVLFLNERDEVTEGTRSNVFVSRGGALFTPPVSCGLLPGILRAELIEQSRCIETRLTLQDLRTAEQVFLGNALRGLMTATEAVS